jgi:hypothetical protein
MLRKLTAMAAMRKTSNGRSEAAASTAIGAPTKTPSKHAKAATIVPTRPERAALPARRVALGGEAISTHIGTRRGF